MATNYFRYDAWVKTSLGPAVPGAQVYVCTQPANVNSAPPSPLASIFSDPNGLVPITQPILTDGFGHADFYALAGLYTVVVAYNGLIQQVYPDQSLGGIGTGGIGTALTISTNGVVNPNQLALNIQNTDGALSIVSDPAGDVTINCPALPSGGTTGQVLTKVNATSFNTQWANPPNTAFTTPGQGYFYGPGLVTPAAIFSCTESTFSDTANRVYVWAFTLDAEWTLRNCTYVWFNQGIAGIGFNFGIYTESGNLLVQSGLFDTSLTVNAAVTNTFSAVTLQPGTVYLFAEASNNIALASPSILVQPPSGGQGAYMFALYNTNTVGGAAYAANPMVSGVLPATLGALTNLTTQTPNIAICKWTP